jgi:hypothetical protein
MKRDDPWIGLATFLIAIGFIAVVPPLLDREYLLTSWLGGMERPIGIMALVVGGAVFAAAKLRQFRNAPPVVSPTDPSLLATSGTSTATSQTEALPDAPDPSPRIDAPPPTG